ncbi:hypothetical protein GH714_003316 [Hevea brasiliensis]|uniref:Major facilitator superfamily (MFS) profile domain-containing protein n=1 Tax=Hevea brasiliensis TaxID=3981 RepID=A0A6A6K9B2_HEVBR|nr:hypothetical protein GH714_003316 [Hevea brasiliensis]
MADAERGVVSKVDYPWKITVYVVFCWILAAFGGLMFGYDIGISGAGLSSGAQYLWMLIIGRVLLGFGVGFGNEAVPLFLSEIAPVKHRGAVNILFQLFVTIGILIANLVNYGTSRSHPNGWRISLGLAGAPALFLFIGSLIIPETPTSLIEHGKENKGLKALKKIRGVDNVDAEFKQIQSACEIAKEVKHPLKNIMKRSSIPPLVIAVLMQVFQQFTGINAIMFYAPVLFQTVGFRNDASLLSSVITGLVNVISTLVSIYAVDKIGRRKLLLQACVQMFISQVAIGIILILKLSATGSLSKPLAIIVCVSGVLICYVLCVVMGSSGLVDTK